MTEDHRYLSMPQSHLSNASAVQAALAAIREIVPGTTVSKDADLRRQTYTITSSHGEVKQMTFQALVEEARSSGVVSSLRVATDARDPIFGGSYGIGCSENMTIKSEQFGHVVEAKGPGHTYPVARDLVEDILYYRREICEHSSLKEIGTAGRSYRAYTLCCTTLVEAYLNRQVWYLVAIGRIAQQDADSLPLKFEERLDRWLQLVLGRGLADLKAVTPCWGHLVELRNQRNTFAHAPGPTAALSFHDVCRGLNSARTGIGGTLAVLREWRGLPPLGILERLQRAPEVKFVSALKRTSRRDTKGPGVAGKGKAPAELHPTKAKPKRPAGKK